VFNAGASVFTITAAPTFTLILSGAGTNSDDSRAGSGFGANGWRTSEGVGCPGLLRADRPRQPATDTSGR